MLAWKGGAALYRAVLAHEKGNAADFERHYAHALALFKEAEAAQSSPGSVARQAITGGTFVIFGDRLPEKYRTAAWTTAYDMYGQLWKAQEAYVTRLPVHARGELVLGGALADPTDGAVLLFQGDTQAVAEAFAAADPYVRHGLVTRWRVRAWATVVGDAAAVRLPP